MSAGSSPELPRKPWGGGEWRLNKQITDTIPKESHQEAGDVYEQDSGDATEGDPLEHGAVFGRVVAVGVIGLVPDAQPLADGHCPGLPQLQEWGVGHRAGPPWRMGPGGGSGLQVSRGFPSQRWQSQGRVSPPGAGGAQGSGRGGHWPRVLGRVYRE